MRLASRFGRTNQIRRDRPLTREELMQHVPSVFGEDKHASRSERSGKDTVLPPHPPLRTVLASFPAHGSSLSKPHWRSRFHHFESACAGYLVAVRM
jgi:hypothetical protein